MIVNIGPYESYDDTSERNVEVVIHDYDTWNLDHTMSLILLPAFIKFKENLKGCPAILDSECPETEWDKILGKIIRAHQHVLDNSINTFNQKIYDETQEGLQLMAKYWGNFWT